MKRKQPTPDSPGLPDKEAQELIHTFEKQVKFQEDILYGVALFFEGVSTLHEDQKEVVETYRTQFSNIIQLSSNMIAQATTLLEQAKKSPGKAALLKEFEFIPCQGHPDPDEMVTRARILVRTYGELFPTRPREQSFTEAEILHLMEAASEKFH